MTDDQRAEGPDGRDTPPREVRIPDEGGTELERYLAEYTEIIDERLEEGMSAIQHAAAKLMRHLAAEVWRASGPEAGKNMRESILATLAQNDAIRGLLADTDQRFHTLQARVSAMEAAITQLAEGTREALDVVTQTDPEAQEAQRRELAEQAERMVRSLEEIQGRLQTELRADAERLREDVRGDAERLREDVRGDADRLRDEVRADLERLAASIRGDLTEALAETRGGIRDQIEQAVAEAGERTGVVLDGLRTELVARLADAGDGGDVAEIASRIEGFTTELAARLDRLEAAQSSQSEELGDYAAKATQDIAEIGRRLQGEIAAIAERAEAAEGRTGDRSERLEETVRTFSEEVQAFRDRAGQGLAEVVQRIREGFQMVVDRSVDQQKRALAEVEAGLRQDVVDMHREVIQVAGRTGSVLEGIHGDLTQRLEGTSGSMRDEAIHLVAQVVGRHAGQQGRNLQAITESLRALLEAVRRSGQEQSQVLERVLRASAGRQETLLEESVTALRASLEELGSLYSGTKTIRPEDAGSFTRRLRGVEQRLERLTRELDTELPTG